jgi:hypothetical protein
MQDNTAREFAGADQAVTYQEATYNAPIVAEIPPGIRNFHEILRLSEEEAADIGAVESHGAANMRDALEGNKKAQAFALANALYAADPDLEAEFESGLAEIEHVRDSVSDEQFHAPFTEWVSKHGRKILAPLALVAGMGAAAPANAGGIFDRIGSITNGGVVQRTIRTMENVDRIQEQVGQINARIESNEKEIVRLQAQIDAMLAQGRTATGVETIESGARTSGRVNEQEAQLRLELAKINAERAKAEAAFLAIPNPTAVQIAEYDLAMAQFDVRITQAQANQRIAGTRTGGQGSIDQAQIDQRNAQANQYITYYRQQQDTLRRQNDQLRTQLVRVQTQGVGTVLGK